jgi:two-component system sensor histidine kinase BarA
MSAMVSPSCPALVVHDDDAFRKSLIATLDQQHFTVTVRDHGDDALRALQTRTFQVILINLDLNRGKGLDALDYILDNRAAIKAKVIIVGEPNPDLRKHAKAADETLIKPVDAAYVVERARAYCRH